MFTKLRILALTLVLAALAAGCGGSEEENGGRLSVVAAFYPLEFVVEQIAGDRADVDGLTPSGVEPHDLELTASQVRMISQSDLLVYLGEGFQPAVERAAEEANAKLNVLGLGGGVVEDDPHVWLNPVGMVTIANAVETAMSAADADNAGFYRSNAEALIVRLNALDDDFSAGLARCARREIVTSHSAFGHMAERFNLEQIGIAGLDPEQEPSARRLDEVIDLVEEHGVTTIFFERLVPEDLAETVASETGASTAVLDPLESPPSTGDYLSAMRENLRSLRAALDCR